MRRSDLDYQLPPELIAQHPPPTRDGSRLLVYERATGVVRHRSFADLGSELEADDLLVLNDTKVVPARLRLSRATGGSVEVLLLEQRDAGLWEGLARPSRRLRVGESLEVLSAGAHTASRAHHDMPGAATVELVESLGEGRWILRVPEETEGEVPLPPYIREPLGNPDRYQTVYAREAGSAAAPTAGLHLTPELLEDLEHGFVTLHIGLDTFRPVSVEALEQHTMHGERYSVPAALWSRARAASRVVAVGTTSVRALESVLDAGSGAGTVSPRLAGRTELMILPGYRFRVVDALVTNFHLPGSTLLALVMAFAGVEETRRLYRIAIAERYRFYSFGDAMIIL